MLLQEDGILAQKLIGYKREIASVRKMHVFMSATGWPTFSGFGSL